MSIVERKGHRVAGRRVWWWVFCVFIAAPAVALALLGVRARRADEIERRQRFKDEQSQLARAADAALASALDAIVSRAHDAPRVERREPTDNPSGIVPFRIEGGDVVVFPEDRVFSAPFGRTPASVEKRAAPPDTLLAERAQIAESRGDAAVAETLYRKIRDRSMFAPWAEARIALLRARAGDAANLTALTHPGLARSDARTPADIPLAIAVCMSVRGLNGTDAHRFRRLAEQALAELRSGRWWLHLDQRRAYDDELRRWLADVGALPPSSVTVDERLALLATLATTLQTTAYNATGSTTPRALLRRQGELQLLVWRRQGDAHVAGVVLTETQSLGVLEAVLRPLTEGRAFRTVVRDAEGAPVWGSEQLGSQWTSSAIAALGGAELVFSAPSRRTGATLDRAVIMLPIVMLASGLAMTVWIVRRELALATMQANFVASVTHEFKSPITSIRLLLERMAAGRVGAAEPARAYWTAICAETERLDALVNRLLDTQALQNEKTRYEFRAAAAGRLVEREVERMRAQADAKGIQMTMRIDDAIPPMALDEASFSAAVANLLDNAIKYSPAGSGVCIQVEAEPGMLRVEVLDQGIGVDAAEAERIFSHFYRSPRGNRENVRGTGLGLALVKATAEAHGGFVGVRARPGGGSCFTLRLPIVESK
jgi:signal transduction histidine kinase